MNQIEALALWGAITGTIGTVAGLVSLWLRFRQHGLDKPKLKCESSFGDKDRNSPKPKITVRAVGRRPVSIDSIKYFITPKNWKQRATRYWQHKSGRWLWSQELKRRVKLSEGEKEEFRISLPNGLCITKIYKVQIIDQTGKSWPVKWLSKRGLQKVVIQETNQQYQND